MRARTYYASDITRLLSALHDLARIGPGTGYAELVERLAVVRVVTKGIVARSAEPVDAAESGNCVRRQTGYLRSETERLNTEAPAVSYRGGPQLDPSAEDDYRREQADYD